MVEVYGRYIFLLEAWRRKTKVIYRQQKFTADRSRAPINFLDVTVSITEGIVEMIYMLNVQTVTNIFYRLPVILFIAKRAYRTARH